MTTSSPRGHRDHSPLHQTAPRLAAARDQYTESERAWTHEFVRLLDREVRARRLFEHRDLQCIRSENRRAARTNGRYMAYRERKLDRAREALEAAVAELKRHRAIPPGTYQPTPRKVEPVRPMPTATSWSEAA